MKWNKTLKTSYLTLSCLSKQLQLFQSARFGFLKDNEIVNSVTAIKKGIICLQVV